MIKESVAGDIDFQDKLHDYLMKKGKDINTIEKLQQIVKDLIKIV